MEEKKETKTPLNRRQFLKLAGVASGAALLTACNGGATEAPAETTEVEAPSGEEAAPAAEKIPSPGGTSSLLPPVKKSSPR